MAIIEFISQSWHWAFSGFMIVLVMFILIYLGEAFGISSSFRAICSIGGAGNRIEYFNFNWKEKDWLLMLVVGAIIGGALGAGMLASPEPVQISQATISDLAALGIEYPKNVAEGAGFIPHDVLNFKNLMTPAGFILIIGGGFLIGFGTRWAGGCTSGHAISGLSGLQLPSLVAVIGFFIGGLFSTHFLFQWLF